LRREFREKYKEKEERNGKQIEEEIKNITTEAQVWKFVNLNRKSQDNRRKYKYGGLGEAFSKIIGRRERDMGGHRRKERLEGYQEKELGKEEIEFQLKKIKRSDRG